MNTAPRFGHTDDKLIVILARHFRATAEQCARHPEIQKTVPYTRSRLAVLAADDQWEPYVEIHRGFSQHSKPPYIFSLSRRGWRYAEQYHGLPMPKRWRPSENQLLDYREYLHSLAITDLGIALDGYVHAAGDTVRLVRSIHDRLLPQSKITLPDGTAKTMRADGFIELHIKRGTPPRWKQRCALIEIDRNTHYKKALQLKFLQQIEYVRSGKYLDDFQTKSLVYLWVCPGDASRVRFLMKTLEETLTEHQAANFAPLFLFTSENPATAEPVDLFASPRWSVPFLPHPVTLVTYDLSQPTESLTRSHFLPQDQYEQIMQAPPELVPQVVARFDTV